MILEGRLLGNRYEILEKIGNGGMATVYKAKCHLLNRYVAVKILRDEFTTDDEFIKRFNTEAQAAASLTHPNIVSIYDVGNENNLYYIVMELIQGKTLKDIIVRDGVIGWKWSINVAIQIASALETAHRNNIVHRDIKPHNIIITEEGIAKVTDFGIAKAVSNSTITAFGTTIGSVHYFSPEHARGGFTDAKSDIYSLGVVMYEMLTGKVPFDADTPVSVALKHMQEDPIEPIELNKDIPTSVNKIVMKAMQKDVINRYSTATEMLKDLNMALKNPEGNFVHFSNVVNDYPTQRIEKIETKVSEQDKKKKDGFFAKHKKLKIFSIILACILVFIISSCIAYNLINAGTPEDIQIPEVVGKQVEEASNLIKEAGFEVEILEDYDPEIPVGYVVQQDPKYIENYRIKEGTTIKILVSKGQETVVIPKLTGLKHEEAIKTLEELNVVVEEIEETSTKVEEGYIIKQVPEANTEINKGSTVEIYVSIGTGIEQVTVPSLIGLTEEVAKTEITNSKLKFKNVIYEEDTTKNNGVVLKQSLEATKKVDEQTEITITVNKLPELKEGVVIVNVKSITANDTIKYDEDTGEEIKSVKLKVTVDGEQVESKNVLKTSINENVKIQGIGNVTVKVYIDDILKQTQIFNLNNSSSLNIE